MVLLAIAVAGVASFVFLDLGTQTHGGTLEVAFDFLAAAFSPALESQADFVPEGTPSIPAQAAAAAHETVVFAASAMTLAIAVGLLLGFVASSSWWEGDPAGGRTRLGAALRRSVAPAVYGGARLLIALMRSVHELLWAILFLSAFGLSHLSAVVAIAIPYAGTLAKVWSEMIDEASREAAMALRAAGASGPQVFLFGLLPRALPDMSAYAFYRFECAVRSSAILGFFGFPTLGYYVKLSFENLHFREVWTYLYALFLLVLVIEWWSGALRRRFVA